MQTFFFSGTRVCSSKMEIIFPRCICNSIHPLSSCICRTSHAIIWRTIVRLRYASCFENIMREFSVQKGYWQTIFRTPPPQAQSFLRRIPGERISHGRNGGCNIQSILKTHVEISKTIETMTKIRCKLPEGVPGFTQLFLLRSQCTQSDVNVEIPFGKIIETIKYLVWRVKLGAYEKAAPVGNFRFDIKLLKCIFLQKVNIWIKRKLNNLCLKKQQNSRYQSRRQWLVL